MRTLTNILKSGSWLILNVCAFSNRDFTIRWRHVPSERFVMKCPSLHHFLFCCNCIGILMKVCAAHAQYFRPFPGARKDIFSDF